MNALEAGACERFKAGYHLGLGLFACGALVYNVCAWLQRRERHLAFNAALYSALVAFEVKKVRHHCAR